MVSRLLLIFLLAKFLSPEELGVFGLIVATIGFGVLLLGVDFYNYSHREFLSREPEKQGFVIQQHLIVQFFLYILLLPLFFFVFTLDLIGLQYAPWFFALLLIEHIAQEIFRLLVIMQKQILASFLLFLRVGSWVFVIALLMFLYNDYRSIERVFLVWTIAGGVSILIGLIIVIKSIALWPSFCINYQWIKKGLKVGLWFLIGTLALKGLLTFDRYAVEILGSAETLGVYVFYMSIVIGVYSLLEPAIFSFLYPKMILSYQKGDIKQFSILLKELSISTIVMSFGLALLTWFVIPLAIDLINKPVYLTHLSSLNMLLVAGFFYGVSHIPHYALYAMKRDSWIVGAHLTGLVLFLIAIVVVDSGTVIDNVGLSLTLSFVWLTFVKTIGFLYNKKGYLKEVC